VQRAPRVPKLTRVFKLPRPSRSAKIKVFPWKAAAVYSALVILVFGGVVLWDRAYESRREAAFKPPRPEILAKNLVENFIGRSGAVHDVKVDAKAGTLELSVDDVLIKPGQPLAEKQKNVSSEGTLSIQVLQGQMPRFTTITVHVLRDVKVLATAQIKPGQKEPLTEFTPDLR